MRYSCILLITMSLLAWSQAKELYSDRYDYINIDEILKNDRLREQYYQCLLDTSACLTKDALFLKEHLPEAFATKCEKCTEMQKVSFDKVAQWYVKNQPEKWNALVEKLVKDLQNHPPK